MKNQLIVLILFMLTISTQAQKKRNTSNSHNVTCLNLNLNDITNKLEETLEKGNYKLKIEGVFEKNKYTLNIKKKETTVLIDPLEIEKSGAVASTNIKILAADSTKIIFNKVYEFKMKNRSEFELTIQINDKTTKTLVREIKVIYKSKNNKKWVSSLGVASAFLTNKDTYRTVKQSDNEVFKIERDGGNQILQVIPLMQFSFINIENDDGFVPTAGIGFDTENISAFLGGSYYFGQNIFITGGFALHKQKRLNNLYKENQELTEAIDESILNKEYYRINPFISITYRLSNNIFKK